MEAHQLALQKAKIALMSKADSAFFTTLAFSLQHQFNDKIPTARTNGKVIQYNPTFFNKLSPEERVFLMLHEAMHCAYLHTIRRGNREAGRFNIACDHVINLQLVERGFKMPSVGICDRRYTGLSAEEIYNLLPVDATKGGMSDDLEEGSGGDNEEEHEVLTKEIEDILVRAAMQSKSSGDKAGTIPGEIQIFLDKLLNPKLPWQRILQKYLHNKAKNDYSFKKFNRRFFPTHYLPSLYSTNLCDLAIAIDTSGSVSDEEFTFFVSEIHSILKMMKPDKITLLQFDTKLYNIVQIRDVNQLLQTKFYGRGGTDVSPVIEWAEINKPQVLLIFTDGEFYPTPPKTKQDVVWLIHNNKQFQQPFGKTIHYEI